MFGRACLSFGLVTRDQINVCVADQRRWASQGKIFTLAQVLIGRKILTAEVYQQVVRRIRQHLAQQQSQKIAAPPDITASGRYQEVAAELRKRAGLPPNLRQPVPGAKPAGRKTAKHVKWGEAQHTEKDLVAAARSWDDASSVVESANYDVIVEPLPSASSPPPQKVTSPKAARERRDQGIRRLLGIDDDVEQFDFGPYRILGQVAAGGMGVIYRAQAADTGSVYALKALINVENANEKQLRRFIQEAQSAMRLDHPGIVKIHDLGIYENIPYFTMDLIDGKDLQHHLSKRTLSLEELLRVTAKVCEAVHYAHDNAVIHRDLKPANIIVRSRDNQPILTDFGLAKNLDSSFKLTAEGAMVGTPLFLSPEQVSGKGHEVDRRCDVYGMGVMLYQMLTNRLPFVGRNPYEVYRKILDEDATPPTQVNPSVPPALEKICLMALAKDRDERYQSALELKDDLHRYLTGEPVQARLPTPVAVAKARKRAEKPRGRGKNKRRAAGGPPDDDDAASPVVLVGIVVLVLLIVAGLASIVWLIVQG